MFWFTCKLGKHELVSLKNPFVLTIDYSLSSKYLLVETNVVFLQILVFSSLPIAKTGSQN